MGGAPGGGRLPWGNPFSGVRRVSGQAAADAADPGLRKERPEICAGGAKSFLAEDKNGYGWERGSVLWLFRRGSCAIGAGLP